MGCAATGGLGCGDALLPADYAGPPALSVGASLVRSPHGQDDKSLEARTPRLALVWLATLEGTGSGPPLLVQPVSFQRSQELRKDWDIGIDAPLEAARVRMPLGGGEPRGAIGKLVYFDDRDDNGRLDVGCASKECDLVKATSAEFVVFMEQPVLCQAAEGLEAKVRLSTGFHHFEWSGMSIVERPPGSDLRFVMQEAQGSWADPINSLKSFARQLERTYRPGVLGGCGP